MGDGFFYIGEGGKSMNPILKRFRSILQGYNHEKYWKRRNIVVDPTKCLIRKLYCMYYVKRVDAKHNCSFGTQWNKGAVFVTPPYLPHGPNGIIVGSDAIVGEHCILYHQVTIAGGGGIVGNNVEIGAGAKLLPHVVVGNHCKVGANAVVVENMPDYSTCVMQKPRIIIKKQ